MSFLTEFNSLDMPGQHECEWRLFLLFIKAYFDMIEVYNPIIVEIGVKFNKQKDFYERILQGKHIGIDSDTRYVKPDILGNSQDETTKLMLEAKLEGSLIDLLFIDANHKYDFVKRDYQLYSPLVKHIIAFHDINHPGPGKLWQELNTEKPINRTFISFSNILPTEQFTQHAPMEVLKMGIGIIVLEKGI